MINQFKFNILCITRYKLKCLYLQYIDKEMDNLHRWFSDKLALGLGNKDLMEKPKVIYCLKSL